MTRRGVWLFPGVAAGALVDAVVAAESAGLDEVWIADEGVAREPVPVLAAASRQTSRIRLGVGITSPLLRHPGAIAATMATLDELSDGRAVLGLGVGGGLSLDPFGLATTRPVGVVADAIRVARGVLGGRPVQGRLPYEPPAHAMAPRPVPVWVGARGPQLVGLAAREADGLFLSGCTPAELEAIIVAHPKVADVAVFGIPNDDWGEEIKAVIQPIDGIEGGEALSEEILAWCRDRLAKMKTPRTIDYLDELPRDPNGKLYKRKLRDPYWEGRSQI